MQADYKKIRDDIIKRRGEETDHLDIYWEQYSDKTHFIYEILQNAEDARAGKIFFELHNNELKVLHNGRIFVENENRKDVTGICDIKKSSKADDLTRIGKLGMGFKSVYAYTDTPKIFSGEEFFRIEKLIRPYPEEKREIQKSFTTLFILPFKNDLQEEAFKQISERLSDIGIRTLLFLKHIKEIEFTIYDLEKEISKGCYLREIQELPSSHLIKVIGEKQLTTEIKPIEQEEEWCVFSEKIPLDIDLGDDNPKVSIAFLIEKDGEQKYIKRANDTYLNVFFPTHETTGLGFLIQGPYKTTPNRSEIPSKDEWNQTLIKLTTKLIHDSLSVIAKDKFIIPSVSFIEALRINHEAIRDEMKPLLSLITGSLTNDLKTLPVLPAEDGTFISVQNVKLPETRAVRELLKDSLEEYFDSATPLKLISSNITPDSKNSKAVFDFIKDELGAEHILFDSMCRKITDGTSKYLNNRSDIWFINFYKSLNGQISLRLKRWNNDYEYGWMRQRNFIKTIEDKIVAPFNPDGSNNVFLPAESMTNEKTIKLTLLEDVEIITFFEWLHIGLPEILDNIERDIFPKYIAKSNITIEENILDISEILKGVKNTKDDAKVNLFLEKLSKLAFIAGIDKDTKIQQFYKPSDLCLDSILDNISGLAYFSEVHGKHEVWPGYKNAETFSIDEFVSLLKEKLNVIAALPVKIVSARNNSEIKTSYYDRITEYEINSDYLIENLQAYMEKDRRKASLLIWNSIINEKSDIAYAKYRPNNSSSTQIAKSQLVQYLEQTDWIPTKSGDYKKPEDMNQEDLLQEFIYNESNGILKAIGFGRKSEQLSVISQLQQLLPNYEDKEIRDMEEIINYCKDQGISIDELKIKINPPKPELPQRHVVSPERRQDYVARAYGSAPDKKYEPRTTSTRDRSAVDSETWLKENYTNLNDQLICQICKQEMPFRKSDGDYYFIKREISINSSTEHSNFSKENEAQYLALCPVCAAKYKVFIQTDRQKMDDLCKKIQSTPVPQDSENTEIQISLGNELATIFLVAPHLLDLKTLLQMESKGEDNG